MRTGVGCVDDHLLVGRINFVAVGAVAELLLFLELDAVAVAADEIVAAHVPHALGRHGETYFVIAVRSEGFGNVAEDAFACFVGFCGRCRCDQCGRYQDESFHGIGICLLRCTADSCCVPSPENVAFVRLLCLLQSLIRRVPRRRRREGCLRAGACRSR